MFTQECFIRKNTQEIMKNLRDIGYCESDFCYGDCECIYVNCFEYGAYGEVDKNTELLSNAIDCGDNEELFLAIAALRDDSDKHQLFFHNKDIECEYPIECIHDKFHLIQVDEYLSKYKDRKNEYHKATVEELIKHFK